MATRRTDATARGAWRRLCSNLESTPGVEVCVIDRTPNGECARFVQDTYPNLLLSPRLRIIEQGSDAPLKAIAQAWRGLPPMWTCAVHDDDDWHGTPQLPERLHENISLLAPRVWARRDVNHPWQLAHQWTSQHALFGALSPIVQGPYLNYVDDAPLALGGEDLLVLFLAGVLGEIRLMSGYEYFWDAGHWVDQQSMEHQLAAYIGDSLASELSRLSAFILFQSLDRLAICSYLPSEGKAKQTKRAIRQALRTFWPIIDLRAHAVYAVAPRSTRIALLTTRGQGRGLRRARYILRSAQESRASAPQPRTYLQAVDQGIVRLHGLQAVKRDLLPALSDAVKGSALMSEQVDFWRDRISQL